MGAALFSDHLTLYPLFKLTVQKYIYLSVSKVLAGCFCVSVIHQTLIWITGSLTCVHEHSCACVYTRELGTLTVSQHNIFDLENSQILCVFLTGFKLGVIDFIES